MRTVRDSRGNLITSDDDGGIGLNFNVTFNMNAGPTYVVFPTYANHSYSVYGSYPFRITFKAAAAPAPAPVVITEPITIKKAPSSVKAKSSGKGKVTISWKKFKKTGSGKAIWKKIKKIQVQYSTDKSFRTGVKSKILGRTKTKLSLKKLKSKTKYFVRVRYYDGKGGFSKWSSVKAVKVK